MLIRYVRSLVDDPSFDCTHDGYLPRSLISSSSYFDRPPSHFNLHHLTRARRLTLRRPSQSGVIDIPGVNDLNEHKDMVHSMDTLQFSKELQNQIFHVISGVLHIGNTQYKVIKDDAVGIADETCARWGAKMWEIDDNELVKYLCNRNVGNKEVIVVGLNTAQALDTRDALTKKVYGDTFQYVVDYINVVLSNGNAPRHKFIGVLDIFGFETFEVLTYC